MFERLAKKYGNIVGVICLVIAALLWGGEFVVAKDVFGIIPPNWTNVIRIFFAALISIVLWRKQFKEASLRDWKRGAVCGILFGLAYALQSIGLDMIDAGLSAFISSA
ncbi:MAG: DMT family transporter, partial [Firmicutes bacterium]|nr:DMT family transporter [Bacillota bacterium]